MKCPAEPALLLASLAIQLAAPSTLLAAGSGSLRHACAGEQQAAEEEVCREKLIWLRSQTEDSI